MTLDLFKNIEGYLLVFKMTGKNHKTAVKTKKQKKREGWMGILIS